MDYLRLVVYSMLGAIAIVVVCSVVVGLIACTIYPLLGKSKPDEDHSPDECQFPYCHRKATRIMAEKGIEGQYCDRCADDVAEKGAVFVGFVNSEDEESMNQRMMGVGS